MRFSTIVPLLLAAGVANAQFGKGKANAGNGKANAGNGKANAGNGKNNANAGNGQNNAGNGGNNAAGANCLNPDVISKNANNDGLQNAEAGQAASATDANNFINFCAGKTITDGLQVKGGSCNPIRE